MFESWKFFTRLGQTLGYPDQLPNWLPNIVFVVLAVATVIMLGKHMNVAGLLIWKLKRKDEARAVLEAFLMRESADTPTRRAVKEHLETLYFFSASKIYAEQPLRDELIRLHEAANGQLTWLQIGRGLQLLKFEDGHLTVPNWWTSIDALRILWAWFMQVVFAILMFYSVRVFLGAKSVSLEDEAILLFGIVFSGWMALYANSMLWPFADAKRIRKLLPQPRKSVEHPKKGYDEPRNSRNKGI